MRLSIDDIDLYCLGQRNTIPRDTIYSGVGYDYDSAGNVLYDSHAGLNLRYNDLNLIEKVMRGDTIVAKYSYLSDGAKLSATDSAGNGLYYSGSLIYTKHGAALTMESCAFTGGRFVATATGVEARYFVTDHLGSVRAVVNDEGEVLERNDYYPFGSRWDDGLLSDNRYRYNGKEAQAFLNNPYLDYGARQYDSDGGIWLGKDPLSEKYYPISPYMFCLGNPIRHVDLTGMEPQEKNQLTVWGLIIEKINNTFSINLDGSSSAAMEQSKQQLEQNIKDIEQTTDVVNVIAEGASVLNPISSIIKTTLKVASGQKVNTGDIIFSTAEVLPLAGIVEDVSKVSKMAKVAEKVLDASDVSRIENAATRIGRPINVVGSRASGTAGAYSDWDYIIEGVNRKTWNKIKNSLPGAKSVLDNTPGNIDRIKAPLDPTKPHITIYPK